MFIITSYYKYVKYRLITVFWLKKTNNRQFVRLRGSIDTDRYLSDLSARYEGLRSPATKMHGTSVHRIIPVFPLADERLEAYPFSRRGDASTLSGLSPSQGGGEGRRILHRLVSFHADLFSSVRLVGLLFDWYDRPVSPLKNVMRVRILLLLTVAFFPSVARAQQSFSDVPASHPAFTAIEYLKGRGILQGYDNGTFRPDLPVNRAEAIKIIVAQVATQQTIAAAAGVSSYDDVPANAWFAPYIEIARGPLSLIDGPPQTSVFRPTQNVRKAEFLKMLLLGRGANPQSAFSDITLPLATDTNAPSEWFYPYMRFALASSMTMVDASGNLNPAAELTRGNVALLLHRLLMFEEGRRTQALLSESESEIINVLKMLEEKNLPQAQYASSRALLAARGALSIRPEETIVKGAVKTSEGFRSLVEAYRAGVEGRLDDAIALSSQAWQSAEKAKEFSPDLSQVTLQMQTIAKSMADEARALKAERDAGN